MTSGNFLHAVYMQLCQRTPSVLSVVQKFPYYGCVMEDDQELSLLHVHCTVHVHVHALPLSEKDEMVYRGSGNF